VALSVNNAQLAHAHSCLSFTDKAEELFSDNSSMPLTKRIYERQGGEQIAVHRSHRMHRMRSLR
jgi:hypothetical protein